MKEIRLICVPATCRGPIYENNSYTVMQSILLEHKLALQLLQIGISYFWEKIVRLNVIITLNYIENAIICVHYQ